MNDSINDMLELQQKIANVYSQFQTPEWIATQQAICDKVAQMYTSIVSVSQNLSAVSSIVDQSMLATQSLSKLIGSWNNIVRINNEMFTEISALSAKMNAEQFTAIANQMQNLVPALSNLSQSISAMHINDITSNLYDTLQNIPDSVYDTILENEDYTRQDIEEEVKLITKEKFNIEGLSPEEAWQKFWKELWVKHPKLAMVLFFIVIMFKIVSPVIDPSDFFENTIFPTIQSVIDDLQDKVNTYLVNVDSSKIYELPNTQSSMIFNVKRGKKVTQLEDAKYWVKIEYETVDGNTITGWIAKRNLIPYLDCEFNSDELYEE